MYSSLLIADSELKNRLLALEDYSARIGIGLNSFPGQNETILQKWIDQNQPLKSFYI